jgi:hypothetical protein
LDKGSDAITKNRKRKRTVKRWYRLQGLFGCLVDFQLDAYQPFQAGSCASRVVVKMAMVVYAELANLAVDARDIFHYLRALCTEGYY